MLLENIVRAKNTNAQLKLLLVKLYSYLGKIRFPSFIAFSCYFLLLGAFAPCIRLYDDLDIRNIQIDSLGYVTKASTYYFIMHSVICRYLFVPIGVSLGYYTWAKRTVQPMLLFFFDQLKSVCSRVL